MTSEINKIHWPCNPIFYFLIIIIIIIILIYNPPQKYKFCHNLLTLMSFQTCISSFLCWTQKMIFWRMLNQTYWLHSIFPLLWKSWMMHLYSAFIVYCHTPTALWIQVIGFRILQNIFLYRFGMTWGWVNDRIFIFEVNYSFNVRNICLSCIKETAKSIYCISFWFELFMSLSSTKVTLTVYF